MSILDYFDSYSFMKKAAAAVEKGEITYEEFERILIDLGYERTPTGWSYKDDSRGDFDRLMEDFGPAGLRFVSIILGSAAAYELADKYSQKSDSSSDAASVAAAAGSAAGSAASNAASTAASTAAGAVANSSWLGNLLSTLGGIGDKMSSWLPGLISQFGSSVLNMENQKKLIDYQNAYNTPSAQMQRLKDAGLNPNLMYSQGNTGNQPSSGSIAPVDFDASQRENRLAKMSMQLQAMSTMAQIENIQADTQLKQSERESVSEDSVYKNFQNSVFVEQYTASLQQTIAITEKTIAEKESTLQSIKESIQRIKQSQQSIEESQQNIEQSKEYQRLIAAQRKTEDELRDAKRLQTESQTNLNKFNSQTKPFQYRDDINKGLDMIGQPIVDFFWDRKVRRSTRRFPDGTRSVGSNF